MDHTRHMHKGTFKNPSTSPLSMNSLPLPTSSSHFLFPGWDTMDRSTSNNFSYSSSWSQSPLPSSSLPPFALAGNTFLHSNSPAPQRDEVLATYLGNRFDPTVNMNIRSYTGYRPPNQQSRTWRISPVQLTASGVDATTRNSSRQHCWEPQYLGSHQDQVSGDQLGQCCRMLIWCSRWRQSPMMCTIIKREIRWPILAQSGQQVL
jgi:hypothetical protein